MGGVVQKKDINTINPKGNYTQSERVQPIHSEHMTSNAYGNCNARK